MYKNIKHDFSLKASVLSPMWTKGVGPYRKLTFSEHGHVAYQIKGNEAYDTMLANILPLHTSSTIGVGLKGQIFFFFACCISN